MMRSLFGKLMVTHVILLVVIFVTLSLASSYLLEHYFYRAKQHELIANAGKLVQVIPSVSSDVTVQALLDTFSQFTGSEVWVIDNSGLILMTAGGQGGLEGQRLSVEELQDLREGDVITRRGTSPRFTRPMLSVALPIPANGEMQGAIFVHSPLIGVNSTISGVRHLLLYAALVSIGLAVVLSSVLSKWIASPLSHFTRAIDRMAKGEFDIQVTSRGQDEVGRLGDAFNHLARKLRMTIHQLEQESLKVASVLKSMRDGVVFVNQDGVVEMTNETALHLVKEEADTVGRPVEEVFVTDELSPWFRQVIQTKVHVDGELEVGRNTYAVKVSPVTGDGEFIWGAVGVLRDTSEQRALERMRRDFVVNISHELRTPLTSIRGFLEAVVDGVAQSPEEADEYLRIAMEETERMRRLAHTLMDLSSIEDGRIKLSLEPLHLHRVVMTVLDKLTPQIKSKDLDIGLDLADDLPPIPADSDKLEQILMNLLHNAVRHSPQGGTVEITATHEDGGGFQCQKDETDGPSEPRGCVRIAVTDSGPGLAEEEQHQVWDRFYKVDKSRRASSATNGASGAGLGLAIVKELVEGHEGNVGVSSTDGRGCTFYFTLPLTHTAKSPNTST